MKIVQAINSFYSLIKKADTDSLLTRALIKFIAETAQEVGVADHSYIVGGSVRDFVMGVDPKDIDIVVETKQGENGIIKNAVTLGEAIAIKLGLNGIHADQYGVVHIGPVANDFIYDGQNFKGQKIEIVTARKEKYDKSANKGSHKPSVVEPGTIEEDLSRRDFTFNTLTWKLSDLSDALEKAPVMDILGKGKRDLEEKTVVTPLDPYETFTDDPSRMLRAVRFAIKYGFNIKEEVKEAIRNLADELRRLPEDPIAEVFIGKIFTMGKEKAMKAMDMMDDLNILKPALEMIDKNRFKRQLKDMPVGKNADFIIFLLKYLKKYNIVNFIFKFPTPFESDLIRLHEELSEEDFQRLYDRLQGNVIDVDKFVSEYGISGSEVGRTIMKAKKMLIDNPNLSSEEINENIAATLQISVKQSKIQD